MGVLLCNYRLTERNCQSVADYLSEVLINLRSSVWDFWCWGCWHFCGVMIEWGPRSL